MLYGADSSQSANRRRGDVVVSRGSARNRSTSPNYSDARSQRSFKNRRSAQGGLDLYVQEAYIENHGGAAVMKDGSIVPRSSLRNARFNGAFFNLDQSRNTSREDSEKSSSSYNDSRKANSNRASPRIQIFNVENEEEKEKMPEITDEI